MKFNNKKFKVSKDVLTLQKLRQGVEKLVKTAYSSKVFSYEVFIEDLAAVLLNQQNDLRVVYFKIQNFKEEFNSRGIEWHIGHILGNVGIEVIAELLEEYLTEKLNQLNLRVTVYNEGPDFFLIIQGQDKKGDFKQILNEMLRSDSLFKKKVIAKIKVNLKAILPRQDYQLIKVEINNLTPEMFNMYGGISKEKQPEIRGLAQVIKIAAELIQQAFETAKYQQFQFIPLEGIGLSQEERIREAKHRRQSGILAYNDEIGKEIRNHKKLSLLFKNEYQNFYSPPSQIYQPGKTYAEFFQEYDRLILEEDSAKIIKIKKEIFNKVLQYLSPYYKRKDPIVRKGNKYFKLLINGITQFIPRISKLNKNFQLVFKVGGDEAGVLVWRVKEKKLWIIRMDVNNLNATNTQLGVGLGSKILDEIMRISSEVIPEKVPFKVKDFFQDMKERAVTYFKKIIKKIPEIEVIYSLEEEKILTDWQLRQGVEDINLIGQDDQRNITVATLSIKKDKDGSILFTDGAGTYLAPFKLPKQEINFAGSPLAMDTVLKDLNKEFRIKLSGNKEIFLKMVMDIGRRKSIERVGGFGERRRGPRFGLLIRELLINLKDYKRLLNKGKLIKKDQKLAVQLRTGPMVAVGVVEIDANLFQGKEKDISVIQGRAASAAEEAKKKFKLYQAINDGQFNLTLAYKKAAPLKRGDIPTFKNYKFSKIEKELINAAAE